MKLEPKFTHGISKWASNGLPLWCFIENQKATRAHNHNFVEIVFVIDGTGKHITPFNQVQVERGTICIIPSFGSHHYSDTENLKLINLMLVPEQLPLPLQDLYGHPDFKRIFLSDLKYYECLNEYPQIQLKEEPFQEMVGFLMQMINAEQMTTPSKNCCLIGFMLVIFSRLCDYFSNFRPEKQLAGNVNAVIKYINENYMKDITLGKLVKIAAVSTNTLLNQFSSLTGTSPMKYLNQRRLANASKLLMNTEMSVNEIAEYSGFADPAYFSRIFHRNMGVSPKAYRRMARTQEFHQRD